MACVATFVASIVFISSCSKKFDEPPIFEQPNITANKSIAALKALHVLGQVETITDDIIIEGVVNADDKSGNYYKQISIQDTSGGITLRLDGTNLYADFPVGRKVYIKLKGLFMGDYNSLIQIGGSINNSGAFLNVNPIASNLFDTYIVKGSTGNVVTPKVVTIADLNNSLQSMLIQIDNVEFLPSDTSKTYADAATSASLNLSIKSCSASTSVIVRSSGFANFAGINAPNGNGSLKSIYTTFGTTKQLIIRDTSDVQFYGTRCGSTGGGGGTGARITIAALRAMYTGADIKLGSYKIGGVVISDAANKNVSTGSVIIQEGNAGMAVYFGGTINYSIGDSVIIDITDDSLINYRGSLEVKTPFGAVAPTATATGKVITPQVKTISQLNSSLGLALGDPGNTEFTLVKIVGATATPAGTFSGNKTITDASGNMTLYTATGASFSASTLPTVASDWTGFASSFNATRQFQIRNTTDVTGIAPPPPPPAGSFTAAYDFAGVTTTSGATDPSTVPSVAGLAFGPFTAVGVGGAAPNSSGAGRFSLNDWPTGATNGSDVFTGTLDPAKYYEVTITPLAGTKMDLTSITFKFQRSSTGVRQAAVRTNVDNFAANLPASINPANAALSVVATNVFQVTDATTTGTDGCTLTLGAGYSNLTTAVKIRFYGINAEASGGTFSIDDVKISGSTH